MYILHSKIRSHVFQGELLDRVVVDNARRCFQFCRLKGCRSANLVQLKNENTVLKYCEVFSDSITMHSSTKLVVYSSSSVYFDGIDCGE